MRFWIADFVAPGLTIPPALPQKAEECSGETANGD